MSILNTSCSSAIPPAATWQPSFRLWHATAANLHHARKSCSTRLRTDHSETSLFDSVRENGEDYILTREDINGYLDMYLSTPEDVNNPYFAPLLETDLTNQPRTLVITAEYCPLRDEGETYAARLELEGNDVMCVRVLNAVHGYFLYPSVFGFVRDTYRIIESFLDHQPLPEEDDGAWLALIGTD